MTLPISVIIPCYRQEHWINRAVDSAVKQADEVIVIYDGTGLDTPPSWDDFNLKPTRLSFGNNFRTGVCFSRNYGIEKANYNLIFPLDADDRLYPDTLERMYAAWKPGTWVYGNYTEITEDEGDICERYAPPPGMIFRKNLTYSSFLFAKEDWLKVGGYCPDFEGHEEDYSLQCALVHHGVKPVRLDGAPVYRRMIHEKSRTSQAMKYWNVTLEMCKERWPGAFLTSG
jgi:glycosyltransferase involved in cell wall biosynthesis